MNLIKEMGLKIRADREAPSQILELNIVKGVSPCTSSGFSLEGQFSAGIDLNRVSKVVPILGTTHFSEELGALRTKNGEINITLFSSGSLIVRGADEATVERVAHQLERAVRRATFCQGCGSCVPQCEQAALKVQEGKISVDESKCIHCMKCDRWPCPTYLA
jgi:phosphoadenosine phosphosulfate reductase